MARGTPHCTKFQHCWNLTIRLFSVITGHSLGDLTPLQRSSWCILQPQPTGQHLFVRVHKVTSLKSWSLLLHHSRSHLVRLTWMVCEIESKWLYTCCFVGCCLQDLFKTETGILVKFPYSPWRNKIILFLLYKKRNFQFFSNCLRVHIYRRLYMYTLFSNYE